MNHELTPRINSENSIRHTATTTIKPTKWEKRDTTAYIFVEFNEPRHPDSFLIPHEHRYCQILSAHLVCVSIVSFCCVMIVYAVFWGENTSEFDLRQHFARTSILFVFSFSSLCQSILAFGCQAMADGKLNFY